MHQDSIKKYINSQRIKIQIFLFFLLLVVQVGCTDSSELIGQSDEDHDSVYAWVWAYDNTNKKIRVYKFTGTTGNSTPALETDAQAHSIMHMITSGGANSDEPAIWMGAGTDASDSKVYAFTTGFHSHVDHLHMETPEALDYSPLSGSFNNPVHMGHDPDGNKIIFANDGDSTISIIDTVNGSISSSDQGSSHSAAMATDLWLLTTDKGSGTSADASLKIVDLSSLNTAKYTYSNFCTYIHGDAYYYSNKTAFVACNEGIKYLDLTNAATTQPSAQTISYPSGVNRVNFIYHSGDNAVAFAPHMPLSGDTSDFFLLLNMQNKTTEKITISGASLFWSNQYGNFALSQDGKALVYADTNKAVVYHVNLDTSSTGFKSVTVLTAPAANASVAISYDGSHVWTLTGTDPKTVTHIHVEDGNMEGSFIVHSATDWIYATSSDPSKSVVED